MTTRALMDELRARLVGGPAAAAPPAGRTPSDWPRLPCGPAPADPALLERLKAATIAQIGVGRAGVRLRTPTLLRWLGDRAVAVEAVRSTLPDDFARRIDARVEVHTLAPDLDEFLLRPDLGRRLPDEALQHVVASCRRGPDVQVIVGDGLSANAVAHNAPDFVAAFRAEAERLGLTVGDVVLVRRARVKVIDVVGRALGARAAIMLVGERPGLGTGDGMSCYMVFDPRDEAMDSDKEVLSNIHPRGTSPAEAARRVAGMLVEFFRAGASGVKRLAGAAPAPQEVARAEPARPRDPLVERHQPRRPGLPAPPPPGTRQYEAPPLQTVAGARCAG
ncbi:MAG: ethanolamine ammonia-lyase subunit EutC [Planctomycetes bacterium]|nr:ethanolamine ammonia-lyase subunit EutC [Planctomycetota bacterium]